MASQNASNERARPSSPAQPRPQADTNASPNPDLVRHLYDRAFARIRSEYTAMPTIRLTPEQVERLTGVPRDVCQQVLHDLMGSRYLQRCDNGTYARRSSDREDL